AATTGSRQTRVKTIGKSASSAKPDATPTASNGAATRLVKECLARGTIRNFAEGARILVAPVLEKRMGGARE
ncbi:hypothetical protein HK097_000994, partial [Rhizophlyctis rosea]